MCICWWVVTSYCDRPWPVLQLEQGSGSFVVLLAEYAKKAVSIIGIELLVRDILVLGC